MTYFNKVDKYKYYVSHDIYLALPLVPSIPDVLNYFISGELAIMFGWMVVRPFDVPKRNAQS